jgi:hypothetical protein
LEPLKLEPLPAQKLSPALAALTQAASPAKLMAVRGMAPLRPAELLVVTYQLSFDPDAAVKAAAEAAPAGLPEKILLGPLSEALPPQVLHFFAERLPSSRRQAIEKILYNPATSDETFVYLARASDESLLEIIFQNEVRVLRSPALVEALYFNKNARMSSVSRALELCARNNVRLDGIPGYDEIVTSILSDPNATVLSESDDIFAAVMSQNGAVAPGESDSQGQEGANGNAPSTTDASADESKKRGGTTFIKFDELKIFEKVRLASVGNAYCRSVLIRDSNKVVAMAVIRSPSITDMEVVAAASNRSVCDDVIRYIANSRVFTKDYAVKHALVTNPKCPLASSLRLLSFMHIDDLKAMSRSKNIPGALSTAARKLLQTRTRPGGS